MTARGRAYPGPALAPYRRGNLLGFSRSLPGKLHRSGGGWGDEPDEWRDNQPFYGTLVLADTERGRSAAQFTWAGTGSLTGTSYPMFITDAADLMMSADGVRNATVTGWWIVVKRGQNYGLMRLRRDLEPPK